MLPPVVVVLGVVGAVALLRKKAKPPALEIMPAATFTRAVTPQSIAASNFATRLTGGSVVSSPGFMAAAAAQAAAARNPTPTGLYDWHQDAALHAQLRKIDADYSSFTKAAADLKGPFDWLKVGHAFVDFTGISHIGDPPREVAFEVAILTAIQAHGGKVNCTPAGQDTSFNVNDFSS